MKADQTHIESIRAAFQTMQSKEDFLSLLNDAKKFVYQGETHPFELKQITWYANPAVNTKRYKKFTIKKKSGSDRTIHAPVEGLKSIQKVLAFVLQCVFEPHKAAYGFVKEKSIVDNARIHTASNYVYNIDLKDFFPSIDQARVWKCLQLKPFYLVDTPASNDQGEASKINSGVRRFKTDFGESVYYKIKDNKLLFINDRNGNLKRYRDRLTKHIPSPEYSGVSNDIGLLLSLLNNHADKVNEILSNDAKRFIKTPQNIRKLVGLVSTRTSIANIIASLCCAQMEVERINEAGVWTIVTRNVLPQGAPTSPVITNIVCQRLDYLLSAVAKRFGLKYSRYADDITFSSMHNVYQPEGEFIKELNRIIEEQGFHIKDSKTRLQKAGYRQEVTGLLVNEKANVHKRYIKQLRMWLYYWERYGYERAYGYFLQHYLVDKGHVIKGQPDMANVISGKLDYLKMVKGEGNLSYLRLKNRYDILTEKTDAKTDINLAQVMLTESPKMFNRHIFDLETKSEEVKPIQPLKPSDLFKQFLQAKAQADIDVNCRQVSQVNQIESSQLSLPVIHTPKELVALLKKFSINDSALKYTTHSWDAGRDVNMFRNIDEFLDLAEDQYKNFSLQLSTLSKYLHAKIYNFLFNKNISEDGWGDSNPRKRIRFGWSSPELLEACRKDPSLNPEDFILPEKYQIQKGGRTLQKFKHIIDVFKNEIEIRDENSALLNLMLQKHDNFLPSFADPIISNLDNKTFYTDVQWLSKALDLIFENIQSRGSQNRYVSYSVNDKREDAYSLEILHIDSFNIGKSIYDEKLKLVKGNFGDICKYLKNLCDWSIESQFAEGCFRINYLTSGLEEISHRRLDTAAGFKHILTFYK